MNNELIKVIKNLEQRITDSERQIRFLQTALLELGQEVLKLKK